VTQDEVAFAHDNTRAETRTRHIPRIIHQIFHNWKDPRNETIPHVWNEARNSCMLLHKDWEYKVWWRSSGTI
jgi:mannosyltransferase OCH1-like enzyme